jgi:hypothetical protein
VVSLRRLVELRESSSVLAPVELSGVNDDTADCGSMASNPLCGRMNDNISTVIDRADEVATSTEGVVDLKITINPADSLVQNC